MSVTKERIQVEVSYHLDQYLMHLIQEVTKRPTVEIIAFFYELASQIADIGAQAAIANGNRAMRKEIVDYFPNTSIPFRMMVKGHKIIRYRRDKKGHHTDDHYDVFDCDMELGFPENKTWMKEEDLKRISEALMERALLDAPIDHIVLPDFEKPVIRSPKMFKALMNTFLGREPEPKKSRKKKVEDEL
jgi:hypothetical protein